MSGSRLGRGRGGRLALYGGCGAAVLFLVLLYRAATSEMAKLREVHLKCAQQQEALAAQLQVIFEYKARLEKSLAEEKSSKAAVQQELQQRASREKSLRDKDSVEAMLRFNSLQQTYKLLQTEHQDLKEECKKREKQALDETNRLETTLQDLRSRIRQAQEKEKAYENFKNKYIEIETENMRLEEKYNKMIKTTSDTDSIIEHLRKEVFQLKRELENTKKSYGRSTYYGPILVTPEALVPKSSLQKGSQPIPAPQPQQQDVARDSASSRKTENFTMANSNSNLVSPSLDKVAPSPLKPLPKVKLPAGVLPIPEIIESHVDSGGAEKHQEELRKRDDNVHNSPLKFANGDNKVAKEAVVEAGNLDPPFAVPAQHVGKQIAERKDSWLRMGHGVQEIGEELNQLGQVPGLDDRQANGGDDQYYGLHDYDKEQDPQQKDDIQLAEVEDEGEDEGDMLEYAHNVKQEKRE